MKILQVNILYNEGSTGNVVEQIHSFLNNNGDTSIVCYGAGKVHPGKNLHKLAGRYEMSFYRIWAHYSGFQYASGLFSTLRLIILIKKEQPDIVHLHCINGFFINIYRLLHFLKINNIKTVITMHAEFFYTGSCGHSFDCDKWKTGCGNCPQLWQASYSYFFDRTAAAWKRMKKSFLNFNHTIATCVSPWLTDRAMQSPILSGKKIITIENGIDTDNIFKPRDYEFLKKKYKLKNEKIILHVTANFSTSENDLKGGRFIIELANKMKCNNIKFIIVGNKNKGILLPPNIIDAGRINDQLELAAYYSMADLTVITSKRETFSMVCAESLSCGTPVVGFKAGAPEQISIKEYSEFVDYGNIKSLESTIMSWINKKELMTIKIRNQARTKYSSVKMAEKYYNTYISLINKN